MRLTKQTNYAIRILMYCAANDGKLSQIPEIATAYNLSEAFLFKILKPIVKHGFAESIRGRNGGIRLAKPASDIKLSDVVRITEDNFAMADCFESDGTDCPLIDHCGLNSALREALNAFFAVLDKYTIQDIASSNSRIDELLGLHLLEGYEGPGMKAVQ
jgi:Rrf2 family protein